MKKLTLNFHADPGHGWLAVGVSLLHDLGIADRISSYSYINRDTVFLEEDCDAGLFIHKAKEAGWEIKVKEYHTDRQSCIRRYAQYHNA